MEEVDAYFSTDVPVPVPIFLGYCEVDGQRLLVSRDTLLPGTETERMIEEATNAVRRLDARIVADVGTGCGWIAVVLGMRLPSASVYATDRSPDALSVARKNVEMHQLSSRVQCLEGNWLEPLGAFGLAGRVDLIVSNPPYCKAGQIAHLAESFARFAPRMAIDGGEDGLNGHRAVLEQAAKFVRSNGLVLLQTDETQAPLVAECVVQSGHYASSELLNGSEGAPRFVLARRE
jgi:release factor glutamine methyltransferase